MVSVTNSQIFVSPSDFKEIYENPKETFRSLYRSLQLNKVKMFFVSRSLTCDWLVMSVAPPPAAVCPDLHFSLFEASDAPPDGIKQMSITFHVKDLCG